MKSNIRIKAISSILIVVAIIASLSSYNVEAANRRSKTNTVTTTSNTTVTTTNSTNTISNFVDMSTSYGLIAGQKLYYNKATNKTYTDCNFTKTPQKIAAILNKAFLDNKGKGVTIFVPAGEYLLDQRIILQDGITLEGVAGQTKFIIDDSFTVVGDDCIISNENNAKIAIKNIYVEYKGYKNPAFSDTSVNPNGIEGIMLKVRDTTKATIEDCSFVVKNNGVKTKITPVWFRDGYSNVLIHDCYIENTSGELAGGCLWFMNNDGQVGDSVSAYNNTLVKNGQDEAIAIWGDGGIHQNYNIYNNTINFTKGTLNTTCDKLIALNGSSSEVTYKNIKISGNTINVSGNVKRIIMCDVAQSKFSGVVFENNTISESVGDPTGDLLQSVFEVWTSRIGSESNDAMFYRGDISFNNNSYTNASADGRRCLVSSENSIMKLTGNTVNSNFVYCTIFGGDDNSKVVSSGNNYNYSGTKNCDFAWVSGVNTKVYCTGDKICLGGTSSSDNKIAFINCTFK